MSGKLHLTFAPPIWGCFFRFVKKSEKCLVCNDLLPIFAPTQKLNYMDKDEFPEMVVLPHEFESKASELRQRIRAAQDAFMALRDDSDFSMPQSLAQLTPDYVRDYFRPLIAAIDNDHTFEDTPEDNAKRHRLKTKWQRKQAQATARVNNIIGTMEATPQLKWRYDQMTRCITPSAKIDDVAAAMVVRPFPPIGADHWTVVQLVKSTIEGLRRWEKENGIAKKPVQTLFTMSKEAFAQEWAAGGFYPPQTDDATLLERWDIMQQHIF